MADRVDFEALRGRIYADLEQTIETLFDALETAYLELRKREKQIQADHRAVQEMAFQLRELLSDVDALDTTQPFYDHVQTYEVDGLSYIHTESLTNRELEVLATLQLLCDAEGDLKCCASNSALSDLLSQEGRTVAPNSISSTLTRLRKKGAISVDNMHSDGRHIVLKHRLESPQRFTCYQP